MKDNPFLRGATLRLFVSLESYNGPKFLVSIPASSTVADLHAEAVKRAAQLNVHCTTGDTVLRLTGHDAILFGEYLLIEILALVAALPPPEWQSRMVWLMESSPETSTTYP